MAKEHSCQPASSARRTDDKLFASWIDRSDSAALAELFDRMAPRLLGVAIHLVGDTTRAEDLVQTVFMTLIENREHVDAVTSAEAWMMRVMRNNAIDERRSAAMSMRRENVVSSADLEGRSASLDSSVEGRELENKISAAIDEISSPYREVLLARLRHGASAAEIAHLFRRSPGQVRVQLHRGLDLLRAKLPERDALAAVAWLSPALRPDGGAHHLDSVREVVLRAADGSANVAQSVVVSASMIAPSAAFSFPATLFIMKKTQLFALACTLLFLVGYTANSLRPVARDAGTGTARTTHESIDGLGLTPPQIEESVATTREPAAPESIDSQSLVGRVVEADTGDPVEHATVRLIRPIAALERWDELRLAAEFPELVDRRGSFDGSIRGAHADWPRAEDLEKRLLAKPGDPRNLSVMEAVTDADGLYRLDVRIALLGHTLIEVQADGFGSRVRPLVEKKPAEAASDARVDDVLDSWNQPDIALFPTRVIRGQIYTDHDQAPLRESLPVTAVMTRLHPNAQVSESGFFDPMSVELVGAWSCLSDDTGAFELEVFDGDVHVQVDHPRWIRGGWVPDAAPPKVLVRPATRFRFLDATTGSPLESVSLVLASRSNGMPQRTGHYPTPEGYYGIDGRGGYLDRECPLELTAWTGQHAPASIKIDNFHEPRDYVLELHKGDAPELELRIFEGGKPVGDATVGLSKARPKYWDPLRVRRPSVATSTDLEGRALLATAPGNYVLTIGDYADPDVALRVSVPLDEPMDIHLDRLGSIAATFLVDGEPPSGDDRSVVSLDGPDGRRCKLDVDEEGRAAFHGLPEGEYKVTPVTFRWIGATHIDPKSVRTVQVTPGSSTDLHLDTTSDIPGRCRLRAEGVEDFSGWVAKTNATSWANVAVDGLLDAGMHGPSTWVQVEDGVDRRYTFTVPGGDGREQVIDLSTGACSYIGTLTDGNGEPISGVWVEAQPKGTQAAGEPISLSIASLTDAAGRFHIESLHRRNYTLTFSDPKDAPRRWEPRWQSMHFSPDEPPQPAGNESRLEIRLVRATDEVAVRGVVVDAAGEPISAVIRGKAMRPEGTGGTLLVGGKSRFARTSADGQFEIALPTGIPCKIRADAEGSDTDDFTEQTLTLDPGIEPQPLRIVLER